MKATDWRFCPRCAAPLAHREAFGAVRPCCDACGFVHFADPKVTVALLIEREGRVLLGRRGIDPGRGLWCLPGGFVDYGERLHDAARREAQEETGLAVDVGALLGAWDWGAPGDEKQGIALVFQAVAPAGEAIAGDDLEEVGWFAPGALPPLAFPVHRALLRGWAAGQVL